MNGGSLGFSVQSICRKIFLIDQNVLFESIENPDVENFEQRRDTPENR